MSVESSTEHAALVVQRPASLICTITNTTPQSPQKATQFGFTPSIKDALPTLNPASPTSYKLGYEVCVNKKVWKMQDNGKGILEVPRPQRTVRLQFQVVPCISGTIKLPCLLLHRVMMGKRSCDVEKTALTAAQVYNVSHGQVVSVNTNTSPHC